MKITYEGANNHNFGIYPDKYPYNVPLVSTTVTTTQNSSSGLYTVFPNTRFMYFAKPGYVRKIASFTDPFDEFRKGYGGSYKMLASSREEASNFRFDATAQTLRLQPYEEEYPMGCPEMEIICKIGNVRVTFYLSTEDKQKLSEQEIIYGSDAVPPEVPEREGYRFAGWDKSYSNVRDSVSIYGLWEKEETVYNFLPNGGEGVGPVIAVDSSSSKAVPDNRFERTGYTFLGWSSEKRGFAEYWPGDPLLYQEGVSEVNLYAVWVKDDVNFNLEDVEEDTDMFKGCEKLKGGNGTVYDDGNIGSERARRDKLGSEGYFSDKDQGAEMLQ